MLRWMYSFSSACSVGVTWKRWMAHGYRPPATTATTTSMASPIRGSFQRPMIPATTKRMATSSAATARMPLVGITALTSV